MHSTFVGGYLARYRLTVTSCDNAFVAGLKTAAETISGLVSRRDHALSVVSAVLGVSHDRLGPAADWNSLVVGSYLGSRPFCLYFEPAFTDYHRHLGNLYGSDLALFVSDFASCGHDLWKAIGTAESIAVEVASEDLDRLDEYAAVTQHLNQWYLRLVEQAFDSLLGFAVYRLQTKAGKQQPPGKPWNIYEAIQKHGWHAAGSFYHPTVRNGIAHEIELVPKGVLSPVSVVYTDAKGNSATLSYPELVDAVTGMVDECLAYAFALRLFILEHSDDHNMGQIPDPKSSSRRLRERGFKNFASSPSLLVESVHTDLVNGKRQTRIECLDRTRVEQERLAEMVALLISAHAWFPDCDTFIVGLKSEGPISFARVDARVLGSWVRKEMDDEGFLRSFDPMLMWPKKAFMGRLRANLARTIPAALDAARDGIDQAKAEWPGQLPATIRVLSLTDISYSLARRYRGDFLVDAEDQPAVRELLHPLVAWVKRQRLYSSPQSKKHWRKTPPAYVVGFLYSRDKRERDRGAIPTSGFYIGQFEWRDPRADPDTLPTPIRDPDDLGEGLAYKPAPNWPPIDRFVPR